MRRERRERRMARMDRRGFLATIGLGGVALTLPKPLAILADIARPPLHVGRLVIPALGPDEQFLLYQVSIGPKRGLPMSQVSEFFDKWVFRMVLRMPGDKGLDLIEAPAGIMGELPWLGSLYAMPFPHLLPPGAGLECWIKPGETPRHPMPEVDLRLVGTLKAKGREPLHYIRFGTFQTLRLDRDEAARLGIVPADEPTDDFGSDQEIEMAKGGRDVL